MATIPDLSRIQRALLRWHDAHALPAPWRDAGDPYACLVAAVMAQQTQMSRVLPAYERFIASFPTLDALAAAAPADVIRAWAGMGYNQRAVRLHRAARAIAAGGWPRRAAALARIEGVGPFTAAIVASFAFGEASACVDTNVRRVLGRLAGDEAIGGAALSALAREALPRHAPAAWNQALMDYGATVCAVRPRCDRCAVTRWCASRERYARPAVAEGRVSFARRPAAREAPFAGSARYYRGRIVAALRELAPGSSLRIDALPSLIADGQAQPATGQVREWVAALERHGLAAVRRGRVSLPD